MTLVSRREFLKRLGAGSAIAVLPGYVSLGRVSRALGSPHPDVLADVGLLKATEAGAEYADIRICSYVHQWIHLRDRKIHEMEDTSDHGFSVRVLVDGAWGFAASNVVTEEKVTTVVDRAVQLGRQAARLQVEPVRLVHVPPYEDTFETSYDEDPIEVPMAEKIDLLFTICDRLLAHKGIVSAESKLYIAREDKHFFSTVGSRIKQRIVRAWSEYEATASSDDDHESRKFTVPPRTAGYEHIRQAGLLENVDRIASEAVEKVNAEACPSNVRRDLIILPSNLWLTIHESVGHPTELDRVLGWEANYAGTSFATVDKLGTLKYGAPHVSFTADRTRPGGMSTCGYDDEGVKTTRWPIVEDGVLVGYQTNRETARIIGAQASNGCAYADSWLHVPIIRIPNLWLEPDPSGPALEDLIADTKNGILIDGEGSYSIDQQRRNFQFGGDAFWEIKNGKKTKMLKKVTYQSQTTDFWNSVDAICNPSFFELYGTIECGKGQPGQSAQMSHGSSPARFKDILVGVT